nr:hypothetical protein [Prolixibacteraceae bacterium]
MNFSKIKFDTSSTNYAPAKRASLSIVKKQFESIQNAELIDEVFAKIPLMFQILNNERQIIY